MNVCPVCRNVNPTDATVCRYCNAALTPPSATPVAVSRSKPLWPWISGVLVAVVLLFLAVSQAGTGTGTAQAEGPPPITVGTGEGASLEFVPPSVTAPPDTPVSLVFTNQSTLPHNLSFDEPINMRTADIGGGTSETLTFTTPAPGTYTFVCTIHPGMEGELAVQ